MANRALILAIRSADHLLSNGQRAAAASILEHYINAHPPAAAVLSRLGRIRLAEGRAAEAARLFERALGCERVARPPSSAGAREAAAATVPSAADAPASPGSPPAPTPDGRGDAADEAQAGEAAPTAADVSAASR